MKTDEAFRRAYDTLIEMAPEPRSLDEIVSSARRLAPRTHTWLIVSAAIVVTISMVGGWLLLVRGSEPRHPVLTARIDIPAGVADIAAGEGGIWVAGFDFVTRIDPETNALVATIPTPGTNEVVSHLAVGDGFVWVTAEGGRVYRIDPATDLVTGTIEVDGTVTGLAVGDDYLWVTQPTEATGNLLRIDLLTNKPVGQPIAVGPGPGAVTFGLGAVWVWNTSPVSVVRVDPSSGDVRTVPLMGEVLVGNGSLWAVSDNVVTRFDPVSGQVTARVPIPRAMALATGGATIWVLAYPESSSSGLAYPIEGTGTLWQIDPATNQSVGAPVAVPGPQPIAITTTADAVWIADFDAQTIERFDLLP